MSTVASRDDATNGFGFAVNGLRPRAHNFLIDGFDHNDNGIMGQAYQPQNTDAVQEVTFLTNAYSTEYGRGGASVSNLTFRSGNNAFHGTAWERYKGASLNALSAEDRLGGITSPAQFVENIFGFRFGGPVLKNKLFFFASSQWDRFHGVPSVPTLSLPTAAGVATLQALNNTNGNLMLAAFGQSQGSQFAGHDPDRRPQTRLSSALVGACSMTPSSPTSAITRPLIRPTRPEKA